jgi:hypothetical protein
MARKAMTVPGGRAQQLVLQVPNNWDGNYFNWIDLDRTAVTTQNQCRNGMKPAYFGMS